MKMPWTKREPKAEATVAEANQLIIDHMDSAMERLRKIARRDGGLVKSNDLLADAFLDAGSKKDLVRAIARRDARIVRRMDQLQEKNIELARENRELAVRTDALETALVRLIKHAGINEGGELVREHMRNVDRSVL